MPTTTFDLIASNVLTTNSSSVTFSPIPATYRDLVLVSNISATTASEANIEIRLNGITTSSYTGATAEADKNNTRTSASYSNTRFFDAVNDGTLSNSGRNINIFQIMDYSATDKHKTCLWRSNNPEFLGIVMSAGRFASTNAIDSLEIFCSGTAFASGGSFYLYGIVA
jgi:hypothetical protein